MRISRIASSAMIALCIALSGAPATAQVGEADKCLKVHSTACKKSGGDIHSMGFVIQNTCDRDVLAFIRKQYYTSAHPKGEGHWRSSVYLRQLPRNLRDPKYQGSGSTACAKKPLWAFCAEYKPENFAELTDGYTNPEPYMKLLQETSACYGEIIKEPFSNDGVRFRPILRFAVRVPDRGEDRRGNWSYDTKWLRFGYSAYAEPTSEWHLSKLPKPAAN